MKQFLIPLCSLALIAAGCFSGGCYRQTFSPEEVLQVPKHGVIRTACNLWYDARGRITPDNVQKGTILRFGSEVHVLKFTEDVIIFESGGKKFQLDMDMSRTMLPPWQFFRQVFTTQTPLELSDGASPLIFERMRRGVLSPGMTRKQVLATCGYPDRTRTTSLESATWFYWLDRVQTRRVIFKDGKVAAILVLE